MRRALSKTCSKCQSKDFGCWTSTSSGRIHAYCRACRRGRAATYTNRKNRNGGSHSKQEWLAKLASFPLCPGCKIPWSKIRKRPDKRYNYVWTKDHIIPVTAGGTNNISNIQPLCYRCNSSKCHRALKSDKVLMSLPNNCLQATFLRRPQRFLVEARLGSNKKVTAYCANPGSMTGCMVKGSRIILWDSKDKNRKRRHTWKAIRIKNVWIGTDTHVSNELFFRSVKESLLDEFKSFEVTEREARISNKSRVDFLLTNSTKKCWIEVKSAFVVEKGLARFPDSISPRSLIQLEHLRNKTRLGDRAIVVFIVQRDDADMFKINSEVFPEYARALKLAMQQGVEVMALKFPMTQLGYLHPKKLKCIVE